jgi:hypothetical protein
MVLPDEPRDATVREAPLRLLRALPPADECPSVTVASDASGGARRGAASDALQARRTAADVDVEILACRARGVLVPGATLAAPEQELCTPGADQFVA